MTLTRNFLITVVSSLVLMLLVACSGSPTQESTGQYLDSSVITTRVKTKLFEDPTTKGFQIAVKTFKGTVQLSGFVNSPEEKQRATELASSVDGVQRVENNLIVKPN